MGLNLFLKMVKDQFLQRSIYCKWTDLSVEKMIERQSSIACPVHSSLLLCQSRNLQQILSLWKGSTPRKYELNFK